VLQANTVIAEELTALRKELETLRKELKEARKNKAELEALKQNHNFKLIVHPKQTENISWSANPQTASLEELKEVVSKKYFPDITSSAVLKLTVQQKSDKDTLLLGSDQEL